MAQKQEELSKEQAMSNAVEVLKDGPLAQLGIVLADPEDVAVRIAEQLATAPTIDALLSEGDATGWATQEGRSVLIRRAEFAPSTQPGGIGIFTIATVIDVETGEQLILTSGATNVVIQVAKMMQQQATEVPVMLKVVKTANGNESHRLVKGAVGENAPL